jgi:hypothetical protein
MPEIPLIVAGGPWAAVVAVVTLVVVSLVRGWLVPGRTVEREQAHLVQRGDDWRDAYRAEVSRAEVRDAQMQEILTFIRRSYPREEPSA